jgi:hypothetical protein
MLLKKSLLFFIQKFYQKNTNKKRFLGSGVSAAVWVMATLGRLFTPAVPLGYCIGEWLRMYVCAVGW